MVYYKGRQQTTQTKGIKMNAQYEMTDGYVSAMGMLWNTVDDDVANEAIERAAEFNKIDREKLIEMIDDGKTVETGKKSPNYYYDHGMQMIRSVGRPKQKIEMVKCSCGCTIPKSLVMNASVGTSCPDCYDRLSY